METETYYIKEFDNMEIGDDWEFDNDYYGNYIYVKRTRNGFHLKFWKNGIINDGYGGKYWSYDYKLAKRKGFRSARELVKYIPNVYGLGNTWG